jgi:hypothetical protein
LTIKQLNTIALGVVCIDKPPAIRRGSPLPEKEGRGVGWCFFPLEMAILRYFTIKIFYKFMLLLLPIFNIIFIKVLKIDKKIKPITFVNFLSVVST